MPEYSLVDFDPFTSDADAAIVVPFHNRLTQELNPRRTPLSVDEFRRRFASPTMDNRFFGVNEGDDVLAGLGITLLWLDGSNAGLQYLQILVRQDRRRRGIGRTLLRRGLEIAEQEGRTLITADAFDTVAAGEAFAHSLGADIGLREHINVVAVEELDRAMLERWRAEGPSRAVGYELLQWDDGYPQQFDAQVARLFVIADEDMPFEDAAFEPNAETAASVRERLERTEHTTGRVASVVRHEGSGEIVGFSELVTGRSNDPTLDTTLTVVHRDHRGHAIGKWVKADAILRGIDRFLAATHIQTENAHSNAPMLGINDAIGFKPEQSLVTYEASTDTVRAYLER